MRVTDRMMYNQVTANLQKNRGEMTELQNQAATQKRITKPSDDPISSTRVLAMRTDERGNVQFIKNINIAKSFLEYSDQSLSELSEVLMRMKELAIQQANDAGASPETRHMVALEVEQSLNQAIQIGNRKLGERYIFGGYKTTTPPFDLQANYQGDDGDMKIHINKDAFLTMNIPGNRVFMGEQLSDDGLIRPQSLNPRNSEELTNFQKERMERDEQLNEIFENGRTQIINRTPASAGTREKSFEVSPNKDASGINIFQVMKDFQIGLRVNDKAMVQESIDNLDSAISQVVNSRAQLGSRIQTLNQSVDSLQKSILDIKVASSQMEDADLFQVMSDMTKADGTLRATLETSSKMTDKSLLDFLK